MRCGPNRVTSVLRRRGVWAVLVCCWTVPAQACEPPDLTAAVGAVRRVETPLHVLKLRPTPSPLPLNRPFALDITLCAQTGAPVSDPPKVDAWMPAHRHGMNYRPTVTALGPGRFRAEGLLFHMPGRWEVIVEVGGDRVPVPVDLK